MVKARGDLSNDPLLNDFVLRNKVPSEPDRRRNWTGFRAATRAFLTVTSAARRSEAMPTITVQALRSPSYTLLTRDHDG